MYISQWYKHQCLGSNEKPYSTVINQDYIYNSTNSRLNAQVQIYILNAAVLFSVATGFPFSFL